MSIPEIRFKPKLAVRLEKAIALVAWHLTACTCAPPQVPAPTLPQAPTTCAQEVLLLDPVLHNGRVGQISLADFRVEYVQQCLLVHEFHAFLRERQGCSRDTECVEVSTGCPFETEVSVAAQYRDDVSRKY